jgi:hypothetical protein
MFFDGFIKELVKLAKNDKAQRMQAALSRVDRMYSNRSAADKVKMKKQRIANMSGFFRLR